MGMFDKLINKSAEDKIENAGEIASEKAVDIIKKLSGKEIRHTKKVIDNLVMFTNASGGTGASTIAANVAYMANKMGIKTIVVDLNMLYPSQHNLFGVQQTIKQNDLITCLFGESTIGESINSDKEVHIMFANNRSLPDYINAEENSVLSNFDTTILKLRQLYDLIILDCPMNIEHALINTAMYTADHIYMVWDDGISSIANTEKIKTNMQISGIDTNKIDIIMNKRTSLHYSEYPFQKLKLRLVQVLPFDISIIESGLRSVIFCEKGSSKDKNANEFYNGIEQLTQEVLKNGGYVQ